MVLAPILSVDIYIKLGCNHLRGPKGDALRSWEVLSRALLRYPYLSPALCQELVATPKR